MNNSVNFSITFNCSFSYNNNDQPPSYWISTDFHQFYEILLQKSKMTSCNSEPNGPFSYSRSIVTPQYRNLSITAFGKTVHIKWSIFLKKTAFIYKSSIKTKTKKTIGNTDYEKLTYTGILWPWSAALLYHNHHCGIV